jgi:hypothetical protein
MLRAFRAPVFALTIAAVLSIPAFSQEDEADFGGGESGDTVSTGSEGADAPAASAPESYVVQPGDTLWGLSERFLNNPWYWPKIWSYNPDLDNPNWIRPGTRIRFYPGATEQIEVQPEPEPDLEPDEQPFDEVPLFEGDDIKPIDLGDVNAQSGRREYFVTDKQLEDAGRLLNAPEEKEMLTLFDNAYLDLKNRPNSGELLQAFSVDRDLLHPVTGAYLGKVVHTLGVVRVDRVSDEQSLGTVVAAWDGLERGAYVGALDEVDITKIQPRVNDKDLKGYIVDTARYPIANIGDNHLIFIDRGQGDGVQPGNTFTVVRTGDPVTGRLRGMADEDIGRLLVIDVGEKGSTAVVLLSHREMVSGDRIEMRAGE